MIVMAFAGIKRVINCIFQERSPMLGTSWRIPGRQVKAIDKFKGWFFFRIYRLNLYFDPVLCRRWKWRKYFPVNSRVLEIGPGGGPWTIELLLRNNEVTVVDIADSSLNRLKKKTEIFPLHNKRLEIIKGHARDFRTTKRYDRIIIFEVLEHILEDELTLSNLIDLLAPSGRLLISTPNRDHIPLTGEGISFQEDGGHVRKGYSFPDFERILSKLHFKIIKKLSTAGFFTRRSMALSNAIFRCTRSKGVLYLSRLLLRPASYLDPLFPSYPRYSIFTIAERRDPNDR